MIVTCGCGRHYRLREGREPGSCPGCGEPVGLSEGILESRRVMAEWKEVSDDRDAGIRGGLARIAALEAELGGVRLAAQRMKDDVEVLRTAALVQARRRS